MQQLRKRHCDPPIRRRSNPALGLPHSPLDPHVVPLGGTPQDDAGPSFELCALSFKLFFMGMYKNRQGRF